MVTTKLFKSFAFSAIATALVLAACTKKVDDKDTTLHIPLKANVKGLDPIRANDVYSAVVVNSIYESLLEYNYLKRPFEVQPSLSEGMPVSTDNGLTQTIHLKKGVMFQDDAAFAGGKGREMSADDVIYSWKRLSDPKNASEGFWVFDGKIKGLNEWVEAVKSGKADYATPIEGLTAPDKYTIVIKLLKPYYQLYYVLAMPFTAIVPKEAIDKYGAEIINHPVGTGPFKLEKWIRNSKITLKKNPTWRGETYPTEGAPGDKEAGLLADAGAKLPFADGIEFQEIVEDQPRWQNFMKGNLDYIDIPNDDYDASVKDGKIVPDLAAKGFVIQNQPGLDSLYVAFNLKDPIFAKNKALRQAMAYANDAATWCTKFYNGRCSVAQTPVPVNVPGYEESYKNKFQTHDLAKAKELLAKAGFADGKGLPDLTLESLSDSKSRQISELFQQNMAAIGIKIRINSNTWPQFQDKIKAGTAQVFSLAWTADYPDGQNFYQLFYGKNLSPGPNDSSFVNAEFDKVYEQSLQTPPGPARDQLYFKLRDIVVEEVPWILGPQRKYVYMNAGWVSNWKYPAEVLQDYVKYIKVDPKKRAEMTPKL